MTEEMDVETKEIVNVEIKEIDIELKSGVLSEPHDNIRTRIILLLSAILLLVLSVGIDILLKNNGDNPYLWTAAALLNSIIGVTGVGVTLSVLERYGILRPIENDIRTQLSALGQRTDSLVKWIKRISAESKQTYEESLDQLSRHDQFQTAAIDHGFFGILGIPRPRGVKGPSLSTVFIEAVRAAKPGSTVYYMNTFAEATETVGLEISEALAEGANVKMLLMHPTDPSLLHRFRELPENYGTPESFTERVMVDAKDFWQRAQKTSDRTAGGKLEVRFYENTVNYPIVAVGRELVAEKDGKRKLEYEVVYTGFYGSYSSERMPYVEWRKGREPLFDKFMTIFHAKWKDARTEI
ncbi:MAG: hypothetical protein WDM91_09980 [Rhizomicrobium sp.]